MATLILRDLSSPGATTKGEPLTPAEVDQNFINVNNELAALASAAPAGGDGSNSLRRFTGGMLRFGTVNATWPAETTPFYEPFWFTPDATKAAVVVQDNSLATGIRQNTIVMLDVAEDGVNYNIADALYPISSNPNKVTLPAPYTYASGGRIYTCFFNDAGTKFYVGLDSGDVVYYTVATPYDLSTASFVNTTAIGFYGYYGMLAITEDFLAYTNSAMTRIYIHRLTGGNPASIDFTKYGELFFDDNVSYVSLDCPFIYFTQPESSVLEIRVAVYDTVIGYPIVYKLSYTWLSDLDNYVSLDNYGGESWGGCPSWWVPSKKLLFNIDNMSVQHSVDGGLDPDILPGSKWDPVGVYFEKTPTVNPFTANTEIGLNSIDPIAIPFIYDYKVTIPSIGGYANIDANMIYPYEYLYHSYLTSTGLKLFRPTPETDYFTGSINFRVKVWLRESYFSRSNRFTYTYVTP